MGIAKRLLPAACVLLAGCASAPDGSRTATIQRTAYGVPHVAAPDLETLAYGVAYAHAEDNVCQTAEQLVTLSGERARWFGAGSGQLGLRTLPNEQADFFIAAHMDDAALARAWAQASADTQALARGYVAGFNRFLAEHTGRLPAPCNGQPWLQPMTLALYRRATELAVVQAGIALFADGMLAARPPAPGQAAAPAAADSAEVSAKAAAALRELGIIDPPIGSNAWAFGKDVTADGRGVLLGNPHFPWTGVNRFWQVHITVPGRFDAMGASIGLSPLVLIGFNKDVAWSHTVSTGKRFTLHELTLVAGDPTSYIVDGQPEKMTSRGLHIAVRGPDGGLASQRQTLWSTRWGPLVVLPRAGLQWTAKTAYALQDVNSGNTRSGDTWLTIAQAKNVGGVRDALANLGLPWVNTIAADRDGNVLYADASAVPDVNAAQLERCAQSPAAVALRRGSGLVSLDGSKSDCDWRRDPASPVPGITPIERMPVTVRSDWVQNSNDSFIHTHPGQRFGDISPLVGDSRIDSPRTRAGLTEIPQLLARGKVTPQAVRAQLFANHHFIGALVMPELLAACPAAPSADARDGCAALAGWNRTSELDARGAHLFREFWRGAQTIPGLFRVPFDPAQPVATPSGLKMDDAAVAARVWDSLGQAVARVRGAGFSLDAPLWAVQTGATSTGAVPLHGGDWFEGVLNMMSTRATPAIGTEGLRIDYGTSYVQTVGFDERGPVAHALLVYGQSSDPTSPHTGDQMRLYSRKQWPALPFHPDEVEAARVGPLLRLSRP